MERGGVQMYWGAGGSRLSAEEWEKRSLLQRSRRVRTKYGEQLLSVWRRGAAAADVRLTS